MYIYKSINVFVGDKQKKRVIYIIVNLYRYTTTNT